MYSLTVWYDGTSRNVTADAIASALDSAGQSSVNVRAMCRDGIRYSNQDFDVLGAAVRALPRDAYDALLSQSRRT